MRVHVGSPGCSGRLRESTRVTSVSGQRAAGGGGGRQGARLHGGPSAGNGSLGAGVAAPPSRSAVSGTQLGDRTDPPSGLSRFITMFRLCARGRAFRLGFRNLDEIRFRNLD